MTEMLAIIAEAEGIRTPTKRRTRKDLQAAFESFKEKRAEKRTKSKPSAKGLKAEKTTKPEKAAGSSAPAEVKAKNVTKPAGVEPIGMNFVSPTGYVREAAFDPRTNLFHIGFAKSTWAMPSTQEVWNDFEKAIADPDVDIDSYYRKAFRGRTGDMIAVRRAPEVTA